MCKYANTSIRFLGEIINSRAGSEKYKVRPEQKVSLPGQKVSKSKKKWVYVTRTQVPS